MKYLVYQITHTASGKTYIGKHQTTDVNDGYMGSGKHLRRALKKYGADAFTKTILHSFDTEAAMNDKERELVTEDFCARKDTYNLCPGGKGGFGYVNKHKLNGAGNASAGGKAMARHPPNYLTKLPALHLGHKKRLEEHGSWWIGRTHNENSKRKISLALSGKGIGADNPAYGTHWIHNIALRKNMRIEKTKPIPLGWIVGRKFRWD